MKNNLSVITGILIAAVIFQSCSNEIATNNKSEPETVIKAVQSAKVAEMKIKPFNDVNSLVTTLSKNGIGILKPWQNPIDLGYGTLTDYYPIGTAKVQYVLSNNLAYYLEGTETTAKNLLINLNLNNPDEKKQGLAALTDITSKTFKSLTLKIPPGLLKAIKSGKVFKSDGADFITSFTLDQSKIETWKVFIVSK